MKGLFSLVQTHLHTNDPCRVLKKKKKVYIHNVLQLFFGLTLFHSMTCQFLQRKAAGILIANNLNL